MTRLTIRRFRTGFFVLGITLLTGCGGEPEPPQPVGHRITSGPALDRNAKAVDESAERAHLILGQDLLRGRIKFDNPRFRKVGKFTQTAVQVVNQTEDLYELEYQLVWRDDDDFEVSSSAWKRFTLAGYEQEAIQAIANRPEASRITVTVRLPDQVVQ
ncbi:MAG: DUF1425 domain-containing protein [Geminicoccaceae bacterium]